MLEGRDEDGRYLVTLDTSASDEDQGKEIAIEEATRLGMEIVGVEECERRAETDRRAGVVKVYGKTYFDTDS